jgi:exosome complex component RRP42
MSTSDLTSQRIKEYLSQGKRFDERKPGEFREIVIETGVSKNAEGSARVHVGKTDVIVGIKMDVGEPYPDSKDKGNLMVSAELLPLSSPDFESGPPKFPAIELGRVIDRGIRESKFIELNKLCIKEGEKVWTVFIDIYSLNDDGNLLDAAGIAAIAALKNARIPVYNEEEGKVSFGEWTDQHIPLSKNVPISLTVHKIGDNLLVDPSKEEELISETRITAASCDGKIYSMQKGDLKELTEEEFLKALDLIEKTEREIFKKIEKQFK